MVLVADVDAGKIFLNKASSELSHISNALSSAIDSAEVAAAFVDNAPADLLSFADDLDAQYEALVVLNDELQSFLRKPGTLDEMGVIVPADAIIPNFTSIPVMNPTVRSFLEKKGLDPLRFDFRALLNELIAPVDLNDNNAARAAFARLSKSKQKEIKSLKVQLTQPLHEELHSLRTESAYIRSLAEKSPALNKSVLSQFVDFFKVRLYPEIAKKADLINEAVDAASPIRLVGGGATVPSLATEPRIFVANGNIAPISCVPNKGGSWMDGILDDVILERNALIEVVAAKAHEQWQAEWFAQSGVQSKLKTTKDLSWIEKNKTNQVDIGITPYRDLPSDWQGENKRGAEVAVDLVLKVTKAGESLDSVFIEKAAETVHNKWIERNRDWASEELKKPYNELSEAEKEKDRVFVRRAVGAAREANLPSCDVLESTAKTKQPLPLDLSNNPNYQKGPGVPRTPCVSATKPKSSSPMIYDYMKKGS